MILNILVYIDWCECMIVKGKDFDEIECVCCEKWCCKVVVFILVVIIEDGEKLMVVC